MTVSSLRQERMREQQERADRARQTLLDTMLLIALLLAAVALMCLAEGGVSDAELEARDIAGWASQGITIARW